MHEALADETEVGDSSKGDIVALRLGSSNRKDAAEQCAGRRQIQ